MKIKNISINNFRNYEKLSLDFNDNINIFIGNNGEGKTNLLEAIYVLAVTKSHRSYIDKNLINEGKIYSKIEGTIVKKDNNHYFEILINSKGKRVSIDKVPLKKISDYLSNFTAILFCPDDLELIKGSPSERRKFLNIEIGQLDNKYVIHLNEYNNLIKNRNEYLKTMNIDNPNKEYLEVLNNQIIDKAIKIYEHRFDFISNIEKTMKEIYNKMTNGVLSIKYINTCELNNFDESKIRKILLEKLSNNLKKEIFLGSTQYGPHKDDFELYIDNKNVKDYGSQGQQRLSVLCIKISELEVFKSISGYYPILLLDDVFSELDIEKRNKMISLINNDIQVFITSTDIKNINRSLLKNSTVFKIENSMVH